MKIDLGPINHHMLAKIVSPDKKDDSFRLKFYTEIKKYVHPIVAISNWPFHKSYNFFL